MPAQDDEPFKVVPYDPGWLAAFESEAVRLRTVLGTLALRIDHNGSTAVPGLSAKPIIDIQVSVAALHPIATYGERLQAIGYVHVPDPDDSFCPFFIGRSIGRTATTFTSWNTAGLKSGERWRFATTSAETPPALANMSSSSWTWSGSSGRPIANLVKPTPVRRQTSSSEWWRWPCAVAIRRQLGP